MRIIGGKNRGTRLVAPLGANTRPTSDRARESLFNILAHRYHADLMGAKVLDIFAGSGALGLEALSRGAESLCLVEQDKEAIAAIKKNVLACYAQDRVRIMQENALHLKKGDKGANLIFIDPPYHQGLVAPLLDVLVKKEWLADQALLILEMGPGDQVEIPILFEKLDQRKWGKAEILFLRFNAARIAAQYPQA